MTKEKYLMMCEQPGNEPKAEEIPASFEDFPKQVQDAIMIYSILPDVWESFSGTFLGKNYNILPYLTENVYEIDDHPQLMQFLLMINSIVSEHRAESQKRERNKQKHKKGK